ncbi:MAG: hypothetical protein ACE5FD_11510, partial [Anaerolineae bacterium]
MFSRVRYVLFAVVVGALMMITMWLTMQSNAGAPSNLRFENESGNELAGERIRLLCYRTNGIGSLIADLVVTTDAEGRSTTQLSSACNYVAAMRVLHEQPSGKPEHGPAYRVYQTSWQPGTTELVDVTGGGDITVEINSANQLVLFNVVASIAWAADSTYISQLQQGLREASAYLYDVTDGQMAFGPVNIYTNGRYWENADFRIMPANDYRPTANVGGMVSDTIAVFTSGRLSQTLYASTAMYLGRYWDGNDASDELSGNWAEADAYRTLIHEWGHYALFLYDEYQDVDGIFTFCVCDMLPLAGCGDHDASVMAYHYETSEF